MLSKKELIQFEDEVVARYTNAEIRAPIHLSDGNEEQLIEIFQEVKRDDWVFSTHRSHYHALLHGVDREWLMKKIVEGMSITINCPEQNFFSSAIMGGVLPIALGTAFALKRKNASKHVWVFIGDMCAEMGVFHEATKYAERNDLPITFIVEDNGMSINTPTQEVWGNILRKSKIKRYVYEKSRHPHVGCGKWVTF